MRGAAKVVTAWQWYWMYNCDRKCEECTVLSAVVQNEANLRVQKIKAPLTQQEESHNIRMQVEREQLHVAQVAREKADAEAKKAEAELAVLQMQLFNKNML